MNYINRLEAENADLHAALDAVRAELAMFHAHLSSAKFTGVESNGDRKDWIAVGDVVRRLHEIEAVMTEGASACPRR